MIVNNYDPIINHSSNTRLFNSVDTWNRVNLTFENVVTTYFISSIDIPCLTNWHDSIIYGSKEYIFPKEFNRQQTAEVHVYTGEDLSYSELKEEIKEPFDVNRFEYQLIDTTECIFNDKIESEVYTFQHSMYICKIIDKLWKDRGFKYSFEK